MANDRAGGFGTALRRLRGGVDSQRSPDSRASPVDSAQPAAAEDPTAAALFEANERYAGTGLSEQSVASIALQHFIVLSLCGVF